MGNRERLQRPELERTGPLRGASTYLHHPARGVDGASPGSEPPGMPDPDEAGVAHGVRLGYKVVEEHILQGQRLAQRLGKAAVKASPAGSGEINVLVERVLHLYKDVGTLCFDALETVARNPTLWSGLARVAPAKAEVEPGAEVGAGAGVGVGAGSGTGTGFAVEVASTRRTRVTLELQRRPGHFTPMVHALHASDPGVPPMTGLRFKTDPSSPEPVLQVEVPDGQALGTYTGAVVDAATNEPRGTLCVRLLA